MFGKKNPGVLTAQVERIADVFAAFFPEFREFDREEFLHHAGGVSADAVTLISQGVELTYRGNNVRILLDYGRLAKNQAYIHNIRVVPHPVRNPDFDYDLANLKTREALQTV